MILRCLYGLVLCLVVILSGSGSAEAESFPSPRAGDDLIGAVRKARARQEDTLIDIARRYSVGQDEMVMANQAVDRWLPKAGTEVQIPQEFILPDAPRSGVVVNIPEMRLYYYPVQPRPKPVKKPAPAQKSSSAKPCKAVPNASTTQVSARNPAPGKTPPSKSSAAKIPEGKTAGQSPKATGAAAKSPPSTKNEPPSGRKKAAVSESSRKSPAKIVCQPAAPVKEAAKPQEAEDFELTPGSEVITYPVSMGRMDWRTPLGKTRVIDKQKDPSWTPPASIKREHAAKGDPLPDVVPPGPDNPLGKYAMRLGVQGYLIHGTDAAKADGIGMRVTHGCMRMYNEDVAKLFPLVPVGAPVYLVNQPVKLGWREGRLYMEVSQPLDEDVGIRGHDPDENVSKAQFEAEDDQRARFLLKLAMTAINKLQESGDVRVNLDKVRKAVHHPTGIPLIIGGRDSDPGWEASAASEEGLAPPLKAPEPGSEEAEKRARPAYRHSEVPSSTERLQSFDEAPQERTFNPSSEPTESSPDLGAGVAPSRRSPERLPDLGVPAESAPAPGVRITPYHEGADGEEDE